MARKHAENGTREPADLFEPYRPEIHVHCYRILGSVQDAEDAVQETMLSAWRAFGRFEGRSSIRTWLYRIATNCCLDILRAGDRRAPVPAMRPNAEPPEPTRMGEVPWLQPYPDALLDDLADSAPGPDAVIEAQEATSLAFITALQLLPPRQRAVLILRDVLGYRASEVAAMLDSSVESVTSALKRARKSLAGQLGSHRRRIAPPPQSSAERRLVERFVTAFGTHDIDAIIDLLTADVWVKMPPLPFEYQGCDAARRFFAALAPAGGREVRFAHTRANGQPALATYVRDPAAGIWRAVGVLVLTLADDLISEIIRFDTSVLASFGLPRVLPDLPADADP